MPTLIIKKQGGNLTPYSREILIEVVRELPDGNHKIMIEEGKDGYTPTRYKFYFGHVVQIILLTCASRFRIIANGADREVQTAQEVHECLKFFYNPVTVITPKGAFQTGLSTTALNDREFIGIYLESIMADFSSPPYNCDFSLYEDWRDLMREKREAVK